MNHRIHRSLTLAALLACAAPGRALAAPVDPASPSPAHESGPSAPDEEASRWLGIGNKAFKEGHFAEAEHAYREALALKKGYDIAGNLGAAELAQGKLREAAQHLAFTLRMFPLTGEPALREQMSKAYEQCRQGVSALRIKLDLKPAAGAQPSSAQGAVILVDGAPAGEAPLLDELFVEPGEHTVEARLDGYTGTPHRLVAQKGASVEVVLDLTPIPRPIAQVDPIVPIRHRSMAPGLGLAAVALVGLGGGAAFFSLSASKRADARVQAVPILGAHQGCVATATNYDAGACPTLESTLRADDTYHDVGVGALIVGSAAAVGAVTYFLWPERRGASGLRVTPILGRSDGGVVVTGSF